MPPPIARRNRPRLDAGRVVSSRLAVHATTAPARGPIVAVPLGAFVR